MQQAYFLDQASYIKLIQTRLIWKANVSLMDSITQIKRKWILIFNQSYLYFSYFSTYTQTHTNTCSKAVSVHVLVLLVHSPSNDCWTLSHRSPADLVPSETYTRKGFNLYTHFFSSLFKATKSMLAKRQVCSVKGAQICSIHERW